MSVMVQVVAKKKHRYQQQWRLPNETYSARLGDLRFLKKVGWAEECRAEPAASRATSIQDVGIIEAVETRLIEARPKPRYKRRDLTAEENAEN
jgi:hypothetical protein